MHSSGYDDVAEAYAADLGDDVIHKPFDMALLDWLVARTTTDGPLCDLGCGPGQVAGYLHQRGADAMGIDLSTEMVRQAKALHPDIAFEQGDMLDLHRVEDATLGGVAAFYSIVNIEPSDHPTAFREILRVLQPGGFLLLSFHIGEGSIHFDEFFDTPVSLDFYFLDPTVVRDQLIDVGFTIEEVMQREPYAEAVEHQSNRAYLFASKAPLVGG